MGPIVPVKAENIISGGDYRIVDGDTVHLGRTKIGLIGIDAPEKRQQCRTLDGHAWPAARSPPTR